MSISSVSRNSGHSNNKGDLTSRFHNFFKNEVSKSISSIQSTEKSGVFTKGIKVQLLDVLMKFKRGFENQCTGSGEFKLIDIELRRATFEIFFKQLVDTCLVRIDEKSGSKDVKQQKIKFLNSVLDKLDFNKGESCKFRNNSITAFLKGQKLLISSEVTLEKDGPIIDNILKTAIDDAQEIFTSLDDLSPEDVSKDEVNGLMEELQDYFDSSPDLTSEQQRFIDEINTYTPAELEVLSQQLIEDLSLKNNAFDKFIVPLQEPKYKDITGMNDKQLAEYNEERDAYDKAFWEAQENYCKAANIPFEKPPEVTEKDLDEEFARLDANYLEQEDDGAERFKSDMSSSLGHTTDDSSLSSSPSSSPSSSLSSSPSSSPSPVSYLHSKDQKSKNIYEEISGLIELNSKLFNVIDQDLSQMKTSFQSSVGDYNKLLSKSKDKKNDSHMNKRLNMYKQRFTNTKNCLNQLWMIQKKSLGKK